MVALLQERGVLTGAQLLEATGDDAFCLWKACLRSERLAVRRVGRRYLRLDQNVEGYARLSPSILREFLTYTVIGLAADPGAVERVAGELAAHIATVTREKLQFARTVAEAVAARLPQRAAAAEQYCLLLAGDIVYDMAHDVPRPERSTGQMVRGSDVDLVVIVADEAPDELVVKLDEALYERKYRYLINPSVREEIDYIVKRSSRLREQLQFDDFKKMVACKILDESVLLQGSERLFAAAKALLDEYGVRARLHALEQSAAAARERAESQLLAMSQDYLAGDDLYLFYTTEESEEFE